MAILSSVGLGKLILFLSSGWFGSFSYVAPSISFLGIMFLGFFHKKKKYLFFFIFLVSIVYFEAINILI